MTPTDDPRPLGHPAFDSPEELMDRIYNAEDDPLTKAEERMMRFATKLLGYAVAFALGYVLGRAGL